MADDDKKEPGDEKKREINPLSGAWIAIGVGVGVAIGVAIGNIGAGIAIGVAVGVAAMVAQNAGSRKK